MKITLLNFYQIKIISGIIIVNSNLFSGQKQLGADPKIIQKIEFVGQLKNPDVNYNSTDEASEDQSILD